MGDGKALHLRTVLAHLQQHPTTAARTAAWTVGDLRARLEALGIPVQPKVKAHGGSPTRGVRREDLAPFPGARRGDVYRSVYRCLTCTSTDSSTVVYWPIYGRISARSGDAIAAGDNATPGTRPDACNGVDDKTVQKYAAEIMQKEIGDAVDKGPKGLETAQP
ncbi:hypothetical protein [Streptomyces sp. NRRL S-646]|uniref:hypothetical protein n=1 Tax=Streptomyces sp. NRRL S-646 TaxID=1463917 RepID=UPI0004C98867|nr:hypothetical protein [Streptomyces sp. NRRL S-646]